MFYHKNPFIIIQFNNKINQLKNNLKFSYNYYLDID